MRQLAAYVMAGRYQAVLAICALALGSLLIPPLGLLSSASIALVVLRKGALEGAWVGLISLIGAGLLGTLLTGSLGDSVVYGILLWLPVWPVALLLRETANLSLALESALVLALVIILGVFLVVDDPASLWLQKIQAFKNLEANGFDPDLASAVLDSLPRYMTGLMVGGALMSLVFALLIGRWLQSLLFNPGGFRAEFVGFKPHAATVYLGLASLGVGILLGGTEFGVIAWNLNSIFLALFTLAGFSVLHAVVGGKGFWLAGVYLGLVLVPQLLLPPVALVGISDFWMDWRQQDRR